MSEIITRAPQRTALPAEWQRLFTALLSDALDSVGCRTQAMPPSVRPLDDSLRLCGRARTGLYVEDDGVEPGVNPYELEIAIVDDLRPGDVVVFACGGSDKIAPWAACSAPPRGLGARWGASPTVSCATCRKSGA
jgi:regulator of RNase E activity RraA